jgi:hypothetical protein
MRAALEERTHAVSSYATPTASPYSYFSFFMQPAGALSFAVAFLMITLGSTTTFANGALPGDALYSVKTQINEKVERTLASTALAKADIDIKHAEERLAEVELLAARGNTDALISEAAAQDVAEKITAANDTALMLFEQGDEAAAAGIHARIASRLMAHADILDAQAETLDVESQQTLRALSVAVAVATNESDESSGTSDSFAQVIAENSKESAKSQIEDLTKALGDDDVPGETHDQLLQELANVTQAYVAADEQLSEEDYQGAADKYRSIEQRTYRALAILSSARRITESTGKEVFVTLDANSGNNVAEESAPVMMKGAATATTMMIAVDAKVAAPRSSHRHERPLQFDVREPATTTSSGTKLLNANDD